LHRQTTKKRGIAAAFAGRLEMLRFQARRNPPRRHAARELLLKPKKKKGIRCWFIVRK
jgi:hypothetical protein